MLNERARSGAPSAGPFAPIPEHGGSRPTVVACARLRLRALLAMAFAALAFAVGGGVALLAQRDAAAVLRAEAGASLAEAARVIADGLDRGMSERARDLALVASLDAMRDPAASTATRRALLRRLHESLPDYALLGFVTPEGRVVATSNGMLEGADLSDRRQFLEGRDRPMAGDVHEAQPLAGLPGRSPDDPPRFLGLARPVRDTNGTLLGIVVAHLPWEWAEGVERGVMEPLRSRRTGAEAFILNAEGTVLLGPPSWRGRSLAAEPGFAVARLGGAPGWGSAASGHVVGWAPARSPREHPGLGWVIAVRQDAAIANAAADRLRDRILALGAAVAALAALLAWLLAERFARPIEALARRAAVAVQGRPAAGTAAAAMTHEEATIAGALTELASERAAAAAAHEAVGDDLARREAELRGLLRAGPMGVVLADAGGRVRQANDAFLALVGLDRSALALGDVRWDELTPPEWLHRDEAAIAEAVAAGRCTPYEKEFVRADGTRVPVLVAFAMVNRATGQIAGYAVDLTERRRAEAQRARLAEQMRLAIRAARMFFWDWDIATNRVEWSEGLEEACGLPSGGFDGSLDTFRALVEPADLPAVEAALCTALSGAADHYEAEFRMRRPDGTQRWVLARGTVLRDAEGRAARVVGIDLDITERKAMEAALAAGKRRLRQFIENAPAAIAMFDTQMRYLAVSRRFLTDFGLSGAAAEPAGLVGRSRHEVGPDIPEHWRAIHRRVIAGETLSAAAERYIQREGRTDWVRWEMAPWQQPDGSVAGALLFADVVTEEVEARRATAEREGRLRRAAAAARLAFFEVEDPGAGGAAQVSDDFRALYGLPPGARCDLSTILDRVHPDDRPIFLADHARLAAEGGRFTAEFRVVLPDGAIRWVHTEGEADPGPNGMPLRIRGVNLDITERRRTEAALAASEARYRSFVEASSSIVWTMTTDGEVGEPVPSWQAYTGQDFEQARGLGFLDAIHEADRAAVVAAWQQARADETGYEVQYRLRRHDGAWRSVVARGAPVRDEAGQVREWIGTCLDITDQATAESELADSEARLRLALDASGAGLHDYDLVSGSIHWDARTREIWGVPADLPITYEIFARGVHPEDLPEVNAAVARALEPGGSGSYAAEYRVIALDDGTLRRVAAAGRTIFADGIAVRFVGTVQDVTRQRATEEALREGEARWRQLLENIHEGVCLCELVYDAAGRAIDFRHLELNEGWARATGIPIAQALGRLVTEVIPGIEPHWIEAYDAVVRTGEKRLVELDAAPLGRRFRARAFPLGGPRFGVSFLDVTEERREQAAREARDAKDRYLLALEEEMRTATTADEALAAACETLGRTLGCTVVGLGEVLDDEDRTVVICAEWRARDDLPVMLGQRLLAGSGPARIAPLAAGDAVPLDDGATDPRAAGDPMARRIDARFGLRSVLDVPLTREGRLSALLFAGDAVPRAWTTAELDLACETLERAWLVAERRKAEAALREREAMLRFALDAGEFGAWTYDPQGGRIEGDARARALLGIGAAEGLDYDRFVHGTVHPDDGARVNAAIQAAIQQGETGSCAIEHRVTRPDGGVRWLSLRGRTTSTADGKEHGAVRLSGTVADVTEQIEMTSHLAGVGERLRLSVEAAELGVLEWDLRTGVLTLSERSRDLYGIRSGVPLDFDALLAALPPEDRKALEQEIARALREGTDFDLEHRVQAGEGEERWLRLRGRAELGPDGAVLALRGVAMDIDAQKRAEALLRDDRDRLEARVAERTRALSQSAAELRAEIRRREEVQAALLQAQKLEALGQLTSGVAHDFNNLLAAIQGSFRLLSRQLRDHEQKSRELVRLGLAASERGARLIAQMMAFARKEELRPRLVDPGQLLGDAEDLICQTAGGHVSCHFEVAPDIPRVIVDPVRLEAVLLNLAANARDAMPDGGRLTISAAPLPPDQLAAGLLPGRAHLLLSVADNGVGMDAETLRRATEPFFTTKQVGKGTGLGLASAHGFAEQSGGLLRLRSAPGEGTTVEIFLPAAAVLIEDTTPAGGAGLEVHGNARILVVDDDEGVRSVTATILRGLGYDVVEAASAEAAESLVVGDAIDMVVTDVVMPGTNGPMLAARLRAELQNLPVLYITGHDGGAALDDAPVLRKPFTDTALARAVLEGLGRVEPASAAAPFVERLRHPALRDAYAHWLRLRGTRPGLPTPFGDAGDDPPFGAVEHIFLVEVMGDDRFRYLHAGRALQERAGRALVGEVVAGDAGGPEDPGLAAALGTRAAAAYRRCISGRGPQYDFARLVPGGARPILFERLLLPCSARGDTTVTHLLGVAVHGELAATPGRSVP